MSNYRGSEWHIWDLHVHSPESGFGTESDFPTFIENLKNSIADVIGINDYSSIEGYKKIVELGGVEGKVIFPVIELRMINKINHKSGTAIEGGVNINFHIIFDNSLTIKQLETEINSLSCYAEGGAKTKLGHIEKTNLSKLSFEFFETIETLNASPILKNRFLVWVPYDEYGGIDNIDPINDSYFKLGIINKANILGSANKKQIEFFLSDRCLTDVGKNIPCIKGSDAHSIDYPFGKLRDKDSNPIEKYCWIKADLTFNGLKQIIYEPSERVKIQGTNPDFDFDKPVFDSIIISNNTKVLNIEESNLEFDSGRIPLNRNLVSIIGGRGQGKSMLINFIANAFDKELNEKLKSKLNLNENVIISWKQTNTSEIKSFSLDKKYDLPFIFIYQSKIKEIADDPIKLKKEVLEILKGAGYAKPQNKYDEVYVKDKFQNYWNIKNWLNKRDENGNKINDISILENKIKRIQENIDLATDRDHKEQLDKYISNIEKIEKESHKISKLNKISTSLKSFIIDVNEQLKTFGITEIDISKQISEIENLIKISLENINKFEDENKSIKESSFKDFKGDLTQLLNNLENYRNEISEIKKHIEEIKFYKKELDDIRKELNDILQSFKEELLSEAKSINDTWKKNIFDNPNRGEQENELIRDILEKRNIKIESEIFFNKNTFFSFVAKYIDGRVVKSKYEKIPEILSFDDDIIKNILDITIEKIEDMKATNPNVFWDDSNNDIATIFLDKQIRDKYIQIRPKISANDIELDNLSAGQKGTIYLCLKLATQTFSGPLIFDQPEDDLDNEFINKELIKLFTDIKKFRQVIIVSHNANLVVNADSEQVIIASNNLGKLTYKSGSLENEEINSDICRILEGGEYAFEKRKNKYKNIE